MIEQPGLEFTTEEAVIDSSREMLIRQYAAGEVTWRELQERGFDDFIQVLGGLGELGLRPPIAPMEGPNVAARERGRATIREALRARSILRRPACAAPKVPADWRLPP